MKDRPQTSPSREQRIGLMTVMMACAIITGLRCGEFPVGAGMDDAYYIEMARSLAEGRGPVIHLNEIVPGWNPGLFPLGFPLLLSPLALWASAPVAIFKLVPMLAMAALFPVCWLLARAAPVRSRLVLTALVCLNPWMISYAVRVFSDLPFTAVSLAAVLLFFGLADEPSVRRSRFAALIVFTVAASLIRTIGLALPVAMIAVWFWQRRWLRALLLAGGVAAALLAQAVFNRGTGGGVFSAGYQQQVFVGDGNFSTRVTLMAENLVGYLKELPVVLMPVFGYPLQSLAARWGLGEAVGALQLASGLGLVGGMVWGLISLGRTHRTASRFLAIYLAIYGGVLLNFSGFPSGVQSRLLLPVLPLLFLALMLALDRWAGALHRQVFWAAVALLMILAVAHNGYRVAHPLGTTPDAAGRTLPHPGLGADWIQAHTEPGDLMMVRWPLRQHIGFTRAVTGYGSVEPNDLDLRIERYGVAYIVLGPGEPDAASARLRSLLVAAPDRFESVHQDNGSGLEVFRVSKVP